MFQARLMPWDLRPSMISLSKTASTKAVLDKSELKRNTSNATSLTSLNALPFS